VIGLNNDVKLLCVLPIFFKNIYEICKYVMFFIAKDHAMMEVLEKMLNLGVDIATIFRYIRHTCLASCQKLAEL
jgi:hypothetical protein